MVAMNKFNTFCYNISKILAARSEVRYYSRYPSYFVDPIIKKDELEEVIKSKESIEIKLMSVKAANNFVTCSVFYDADVHLLSQRLMRNGNRILAKNLVDKTLETIKRLQLEKYYGSAEEIRDTIELNPRVIFHKALENTTPILSTKIVKRSGTFYTIPAMVTPRRAKFLAMKFLIEAAAEKDKKERFYYSFALELIKAYQNKGKAVQKKIDLHKYCEANRAYAHFRWT